MKPVAIDLFCGKGGWTNALLDAGFVVYGFDINHQPDYRGIFVQCDILAMTADDLRAYGAVFATCSSPCEEFSVHGMKHFHPNPKWPEMGIKLFLHAKRLLEVLGIPHVMENVRPAQKFVGKSVNHCGPFHLWGDAVPALFPKDAYKVIKGMTREAMGFREFKGSPIWNRKHALISSGSKSKQRKEMTARNAMIPELIARTVAETAKYYAFQAA